MTKVFIPNLGPHIGGPGFETLNTLGQSVALFRGPMIKKSRPMILEYEGSEVSGFGDICEARARAAEMLEGFDVAKDYLVLTGCIVNICWITAHLTRRGVHGFQVLKFVKKTGTFTAFTA